MNSPRARSTPARPAKGAVCVILVLLLCCLGAGLVQAQPPAAPGAAATHEFTSAVRSIPGQAPKVVTLPDAVEAGLQWPGTERDLVEPVYRITYDKPAGVSNLAVYLPGVFAHSRLSLNGTVLYDGIATPPLPRPRSYQRLRLVTVHPALWKNGANTLEITLSARASTLMPAVWVGPEPDMRERYTAKLMGVVVLPGVLAAVVAAMSVLMMLLWWRQRQESLLGFLGGGTFLWALHTGWTLLPWTPLTGLHYRVWWTSMYTMVAALLLVFVLRLTESERPRIVGALWGMALAGPLLLYGAAALGVLDLALEVWRLAWVLAIAVVVALIVGKLWRAPTGDGLFVVLTGLITAAFGLRDWFVGRGGADTIPVILTPYASLLFIALMMWLLVDRFVFASNELEAMNRNLEARVASKSRELSLALDQMREAKEFAESANRTKTAFLATASHDLRQPIHALGLYLGAMRSERPTERQAELIERMGSSMAALDDMFNALLDISRMDAGAVVPRSRPFAIGPLLHRLAGEFGTVADARGLRLSVHLSRHTRDLQAMSDPMLFERIVRNLLANAVKYTRDGGVLLGCRWRAGPPAMWQVEVVDTGPGIAVEDRERIFDEFFQVGNPERDRASGLGLGLSIVQRLTQLLDLRLRLHTEPGHGSRFVLEVPVTAMPAVPEPEVVISGSLEGLCVAVIEDDADVRRAMVTLLASWGCIVLDGADATDVLAHRAVAAPQAIVADYRLRHGRTGVQEVMRLREAWGESVPALVVSGDSAPERVSDIQASGLPWLPKPAPAARLRSWLIQARRLSASQRVSAPAEP